MRDLLEALERAKAELENAQQHRLVDLQLTIGQCIRALSIAARANDLTPGQRAQVKGAHRSACKALGIKMDAA